MTTPVTPIWHPGIPEAYRHTITTGDARKLARRVPRESVDLIFTDPVYDRLEDYRFLGRLAGRVLKPNGNLLAFCRVRDMEAVRKAVCAGGLTWHWMIPYVVLGSGLRLFQYKVFNKYQPLMWFGRGKPSPRRFWTDYLQVGNGTNTLPDSSQHRWSKHPEPLAQMLLGMTHEGETVLDPFAGGAAVVAVAKMFRRPAFGFECDPDSAEAGRKRVAATPAHEFLKGFGWEDPDASGQAPIDLEWADGE